MFSGKYVFSQVVELCNKYEFDKCEKRYKGDYLIHFVRPLYANSSIPKVKEPLLF